MADRFTPGPWSVLPGDTLSGHRQVGAGVAGLPLHTVATAHAYDMPDPEATANAHLIAAAPDLLESLRAVMSWVENWDCPFKEDDEWPLTRDQVAAAIAKATGQ